MTDRDTCEHDLAPMPRAYASQCTRCGAYFSGADTTRRIEWTPDLERPSVEVLKLMHRIRKELVRRDRP